MSAFALERVIAAMAGPDARPRPDQARAVEHLVEGRHRVLVVQATVGTPSSHPGSRNCVG